LLELHDLISATNSASRPTEAEFAKFIKHSERHHITPFLPNFGAQERSLELGKPELGVETFLQRKVTMQNIWMTLITRFILYYI